MSRLSLALAFSLVLAPAFAEDAKPPVSANPGATTASYGDWILRCQRVGEGDKAQKICEIVQSILAAPEGKPKQTVSQLAFGRIKSTDPWRVTAHVPVNILFPSVVKFAADEKVKPMELPWRRCIPSGCFADAPMSDAQFWALGKQTEKGFLEFTDAINRPVKFPVSFRGFAQAVEALAKE
jgi:invasion protein IalB